MTTKLPPFVCGRGMMRPVDTNARSRYVQRNQGAELYRLGPTILRLSTRMLSQYPVRDIAAPYLYRLSLDLGLTVSLSKYEDGYVTYLDCKESPEPIHIV